MYNTFSSGIWQDRRCFLTGRMVFVLIFSFLIDSYACAQAYDSVKFYIQQYDYQKALDGIKGIPNSEDPELLELKVTALKGLKRYQEAIGVYEKILESDTSDLNTIIDLANCYQSIGDYKQAQGYFRKGLELRPGNNYLNLQLADVYYQGNDFHNALSAYFQIFSVDSSFYPTRQIARCFDNIGQSDTAIYYYQKAVDMNPVDFPSAYKLANLYKKKAYYYQGIDVTGSYLKHDSTNIKMLKLNGYIYFLNRDYMKAVNSFNRCIDQNDTSNFTYKYLGYSYFKASDYENATDFLAMAFFKDTTDIQLCYALGVSYNLSEYNDQAVYYLNKTLEMASPSPEFVSQIYQNLANVDKRLEQYQKALENYTKAYTLTPHDPMLLYKLASLHDSDLNNNTQALEYYQAFMDVRQNADASQKNDYAMLAPFYAFAENRIREIKEEMFLQEGKEAIGSDKN